MFLALPLLMALAHGAKIPSSIPRAPSETFHTQGVFEGGTANRASIEQIRFANHKTEGFERWVLDFSDENRRVGKAAPRFRVQYIQGREASGIPHRFRFILRAIDKNNLNPTQLAKLSSKSHLVQEVILYPQIENGDMAMDWILKTAVAFSAHQPVERSGRIVLDIKPAQ